MKLKLLNLAHSILLKIETWASNWKDEINWRIVALTPVGSNPHTPNTICWFLHEEGNRLRANHRLVAKTYNENPWLDLIKKENNKP